MTDFNKGTPITQEIAVELRQLVFGTAAAPPRGEWTRTPFTFSTPNQDLAYGLVCPRNGTRGLLSAVQAFILKYFLFDRRIKERSQGFESVLKPNEAQQTEALVSSLTEILNLIADKNKVYVVLPSEESYIPHSITYFQDSVTEKLHIFELRRGEETQMFMKKNIHYFTEEEGPGTLLFLYCCVFTRHVARTKTDLDAPRGSYLVGNQEEGSLNIVMLLLTGRATPYLHNGVVHVGDEESYANPQYGVLNRCVVGLLIYENDKNNAFVNRQPGSRLKTPTTPIWVSCCTGHYGVAYNTNPDLLRNYHAESRFDLYYYSCSGSLITMTIDNKHTNDRASFMLQRQTSTVNAPPPPDEKGEEFQTTPLERLIHTKWEEAHIKFHVQPSTLSYLFNPHK
ncbi:inactive ubiquitin carboxyl-terminal hydrolase MINDY-4B [Condylostylus longicornis]|uniref:inactive ubiquitin carboxyl-terminal hydrolase MINDY-4B n=1 Tax=Condylostylus longicornis TaxID=2530218 RepID=UPI00244E5A99|nr:inactive ubiquitin carboxyl-terminal hydrolase MINDY-4B [Condylostylus longicornis]